MIGCRQTGQYSAEEAKLVLIIIFVVQLVHNFKGSFIIARPNKNKRSKKYNNCKDW